MEDALTEIKQAKRSHHSDNAQHRGDPEHQAHVPGLGLVFVMNVVVSDGQDGSIVQQRQHHDHHRCQRIEVKHQDRERHEEQHAQRFCDAVDRVAVHALENAPALLDCVDDYREAGRQQHDGGRRARRVCRARNSDAAIGFLQRRSVVYAVAGHADDVAALLQDIHDMVFMFGENLRETVGLFDCFRGLRRLVMLYIA